VVSNDLDLANLGQSTRAFITNEMYDMPEGAEDPSPYDMCGVAISDFTDERNRFDK